MYFLFFQYLLLARLLLLPPKSIISSLISPNAGDLNKEFKTFLPTQLWWASRVLLIHQRILSELSPSIRRLLVAFNKENLALFGKPDNFQEEKNFQALNEGSGRSLSKILAAEVHLEVGLMEITYGYTDQARWE